MQKHGQVDFRCFVSTKSVCFTVVYITRVGTRVPGIATCLHYPGSWGEENIYHSYEETKEVFDNPRIK